jgi:hypothetical protein
MEPLQWRQAVMLVTSDRTGCVEIAHGSFPWVTVKIGLGLLYHLFGVKTNFVPKFWNRIPYGYLGEW